jgi:hypothetical protein
VKKKFIKAFGRKSDYLWTTVLVLYAEEKMISQ